MNATDMNLQTKYKLWVKKLWGRNQVNEVLDTKIHIRIYQISSFIIVPTKKGLYHITSANMIHVIINW